MIITMTSSARPLTTVTHGTSSRLLHALKKIDSKTTTHDTRKLPRTLSYSCVSRFDSCSKPGENEIKTKVNEWSNCLRATLFSNLSPCHASKSKYISTSLNDNVSKSLSHSTNDSPETVIVEKQHSNENSIREEPTMMFGMESKDAEVALGRSNGEENDWTTTLQKTVDLDVRDIAENKSDEDQNNRALDINVVIKIKPQESEYRIGFQEICQNENGENDLSLKTCDGNMDGVISSQGDVKNGKSEFVTNEKKVNEEIRNLNSNVTEINEKQNILIPKSLLLEELGNVYLSYKNQDSNQDFPVESVNKLIPEAIKRNVDKVKKAYLESLRLHEGVGSSMVTDPTVISSLELPGQEVSRMRAFLPQILKPNPQIGAVRMFTTTSVRHDKKSDCGKAQKLPCLQASELSKTKADSGGKGACEKFCMPCCKPARDPPECFFPYTKPQCTKHKPPRPAFSECKQLFPLQLVQPCECIRAIGASCKKSKESTKCAK